MADRSVAARRRDGASLTRGPRGTLVTIGDSRLIPIRSPVRSGSALPLQSTESLPGSHPAEGLLVSKKHEAAFITGAFEIFQSCLGRNDVPADITIRIAELILDIRWGPVRTPKKKFVRRLP